jgi:acyl-coenzyme A thioesterase PaaI-like protein
LTSEVLRGPADEGLRFEIRPHNCFACGELNEHGLQLRMHLDERGSWTEIALPERFEGWQAIAHGGILATLADEAMAWALFTDDQVGLTARLSLDFRRPAATGRRLRVEGWITARRRLRYDTAARVVDIETGDVLVEATGVYMAAPPSRAQEIRERYDIRVTAAGA